LGEIAPGVDAATIDEALEVAREFARALVISDVQNGESLQDFERLVFEAWVNYDKFVGRDDAGGKGSPVEPEKPAASRRRYRSFNGDRSWAGLGRAEPFEAQDKQASPLQGVTGGSGEKSPITFVTEFFGAESYRFFFGTGSDLAYELALLPTVDHECSAADGFERGRDCCDAGAIVGGRLGGWCSVVGASG
jgi:hypothetical protein